MNISHILMIRHKKAALLVCASLFAVLVLFSSPVFAAEPETKNTEEASAFIKSKKVKVSKRMFLNQSSYRITWEDFPGADGYQFKLCVHKSFKKKYKPSQCDTPHASMTVRKIKKNTCYYYKIRAYKETATKRVYSKWTAVYKIKRKKQKS